MENFKGNAKSIETVINILNEIEIDGEDMQHILEEIGMDEQMRKQLIATCSEEELEQDLREMYKLETTNK